MTPSGIEPGNFRFVTQQLDYRALLYIFILQLALKWLTPQETYTVYGSESAEKIPEWCCVLLSTYGCFWRLKFVGRKWQY